jgi:inorganic triphosphatase YgiF
MQDSDKRAAPRELELKLEIDPSQIDRFRKHRLFESAGTPRQLRSVYFDTARFALRDNGISFRVRQDAEKQVQTIKAERPRTGVALDRGEWEHELPSSEPDFSKAAGTPLDPFVQDGASRRIKPVFTVHAERVVGRCAVSGAEIELALDNATIEVEGRRSAFAEIELELKSGSAKSLYAAALDLAESGPVRLSMQTKSGRGYALLAQKKPVSVKAEKVSLRAGEATAVAFQIIANSCLRQLIENETILRVAANPEAVHQARVAIRRLRAAISIFRIVVADDDVGAIKAQLKSMADPLGKARDLDVFIAKVLKPARKTDKAVNALLQDYRVRRDTAYAEALEAVGSDKFGLALLQVAAWIETGPWLSQAGQPAAGLREIPAESFAAGEIGRRWTKLRKRLKGIDEIDEERRHRVRIEVKKLRYATEFFSALFVPAGEKGLRAAQTVIEALQSTLGDLNDIAVARSTASAAGAQSLAASGEQAIPGLLLKAKEQARQFRELQPFWTEPPTNF